MKDISGVLESGIIELYVLGLASAEELLHVESLRAIHPEINIAIDNFSRALEQNAAANAVTPDPTIKPFLMATIDFMSRLQKGEEPSYPPELNDHSTIADYSAWLNRLDMVLTDDLGDVYAKIIGHTPQMTTAIVWIKEMAPQEVHDDEYEKFLIVEGTCNIFIEDNVHQLSPGDYLSIPLHKKHSVQVTSANYCKAVLQRVAA